jgi:hypothetical protein
LTSSFIQLLDEIILYLIMNKNTSPWCQHDVLGQVDFLLKKRWIFNEDKI